MRSEYINCKNCKDDCRCRGKNITPICVSFTPVKTTNADRIRQMTDEELAEFFQNTTFFDSCFIYKNECGKEDYPCSRRFLEWLKSPVEVDNGT